MTMPADKAAELRKPFPPEVIGKLPKGGVMLDFVGHAATTDRLLQVDPDWSWEPFALDVNGLPALDSKGNLWIRLTICGVTRIGVGDGKTAKEVIGDAIRNAAMRFGVALDLWSKDDLEQTSGEGATRLRAALAAPPTPAPDSPAPDEAAPGGITTAQTKKLHALCNELGLDREQKLAGCAATVGHPVESTSSLTRDEAKRVIDRLEAKAAEQTPAAS